MFPDVRRVGHAEETVAGSIDKSHIMRWRSVATRKALRRHTKNGRGGGVAQGG